MKHSTKEFPPIASEGWLFIGIALALLILSAAISLWLAVPFLIIFLFVLQFFRDPAREVPAGENLVLSPADGKIVSIAECTDPYINQRALKISVFMNVFNVHSNRIPMAGCVDSIHYSPGKFVNAVLDKASAQNERNAMIMSLPDGSTYTIVQVAGLVARRILCYVEAGNHLEAGDRYGFIRFGSRVDVYLPLHAEPRVMIGEKVKATSSILATLPKVSSEVPGPEQSQPNLPRAEAASSDAGVSAAHAATASKLSSAAPHNPPAAENQA